MEAFDQDNILYQMAKNPKKFGLPTFKEFQRNPSAWKIRHDMAFSSADNQSPFKNLRKKVHYFQRSLEQRDYCGNIEKVESIAREEGWGLFDLEMKPELKEDHSTGIIVEVTWWPKHLLKVKQMLDENPIEAAK